MSMVREHRSLNLMWPAQNQKDQSNQHFACQCKIEQTLGKPTYSNPAYNKFFTLAKKYFTKQTL